MSTPMRYSGQNPEEPELYRAEPASPTGGTPTNQVTSADLMQGKGCLQITHNGTIYRLQTTRQGKLILTK